MGTHGLVAVIVNEETIGRFSGKKKVGPFVMGGYHSLPPSPLFPLKLDMTAHKG